MTYLHTLLTYRKLPFADKLRTLKKNKGHFIILELNSGIIKWPKRTTALRFYKILLVGEIWEKLEVCSVILPQRITALRLREDGKGRIMECAQ